MGRIAREHNLHRDMPLRMIVAVEDVPPSPDCTSRWCRETLECGHVTTAYKGTEKQVGKRRRCYWCSAAVQTTGVASPVHDASIQNTSRDRATVNPCW